MRTLNSFFILIIVFSCSRIKNMKNVETSLVSIRKKAFCTIIDEKKNKFEEYEQGELPCLKYKLKVSTLEHLEIKYITLNENADDIYDRGYQVLRRIKNKKIIEEIKLRKDEDAYWHDTPFVRVRKKNYFSDLDGDGYMEFAIYPFSPGSAIVGTVRIFSLKREIEFWGYGRYQFESDTFVRLNCSNWSKFNPEALSNCR